MNKSGAICREMDAENMQKWKEQFQTERKKQVSRVRGLQKETVLRRKAMEMKAQVEAAKEEKRRKEALAERKAQHMEATMRFQKGIKNFKIKKEKISLDDVLKQMSPVRSRLNSADSERTRLQHSELASYYCANKRPVSGALKRSSSFDSIKPARFNKFNLDQFNSTAPSHLAPHFRQAITDNQQQIHEMNREALREFQSAVQSELANHSGSYATNFVYPMHQKFSSMFAQSDMVKKESETYSEVGTILTVDDEDERDSLDTDSLLNARVDSPDFAKATSDKQSGKEDVEIEIKAETKFNNYFNLLAKPVDEPKPVNGSKPVDRPKPVNGSKPVDGPKPVNGFKTESGLKAVWSQSSGNLARRAGKEIKGILKRSSSVDNAGLVISGVTKTASCFKSDKVIKDSIELANNRLNGCCGESESSRKKSVRFAHDQESGQVDTCQGITSQTTDPINVNSNETSTRISSTNSIRRPIIKPRNTSQIKQQPVDSTIDQKNLINENSKPPLPNGQSGYSTLNQKRREFFQRNRLLSDKQAIKSPKSAPSPVPNQDHNSNFIFNKPDESKNNSLNDRIFRQVVYNFQDGRAKQTPSSTNAANNPSKELQINVAKNEPDQDFDLPHGNFTMAKSANQNMAQQFVQKNQEKVLMLNVNDQYGFKKHFGYSPNSRPVQDNSAMRLAYLNNSVQQQRQSQYNTAPRVLSADSQSKNQNQAIQLDFKYPLYSNFQNQNNQYNARPVRHNFSQEQPNSAKEVLDSMALFLKAEEMSNKNYSESQIINTVQAPMPKNGTNYLEQNMTSLSLEEQRIKSSLMRLDERYNFLKTHNQTRYNNEEMNGRRFNVMNKYQRAMSTNVIRYRK